MALPPLPRVARTAIVHQLNGADLVNVINWQFAADVTSVDLETLTEEIATQWTTWPMAGLSVDLQLLRIEGRQAVPGSGLAHDFELDPPVVGGSLSACDNNQTATVASLRTGRAGRSFRGRLFIGGIPNNIPENGLLPAAWRANMADGLKTTIQAVEGLVGCEAVVVSYFSNKVQRVTPVVTPINNVLCVTPYPAGQERRRPGIGS